MATLDTSAYRQNTYGPPTHYCDPTRSLASAGAGTLGDPWNLDQAAANAVGGNVVGVLPGVGVVLTSTDNDNIATFRPANSGTLGNRIVFVTKYAAIALANVDSNVLRTQLRHDGIPEVACTAPGPETGSAIYGCYNTSYCTFDGFFVDMASAEPKSDSGVIHEEGGTGNHFLNWVVKGKTTNMHSNAVIYRPQQCTDSVLRNWRVTGFHNTGACATQEGLFCDTYGWQNGTIEYFEYSDGDTGVFLKGTAPGPIFNYGRIRYGKIFDVDQAMRFNDLDATGLTEVDHNLIYNFRATGIVLSAETTSTRNLHAHHNTVANGAATGGGANGPLYIADDNGALGAANVEIEDNIFDWANASVGRAVEAGEHVESMPSPLNYNYYYRGGTTVQWSYNGTDYSTMANWRTATSREANSQVAGSEWANNRAGDDYTVAAGSAALTASNTGGEVGAYEGSEVPGPYGSYTADPVLVQSAEDITSPWITDGTGVATFPAPTTVGNTIIAIYGVNANVTFTIADDGSGGSNTYGQTTRSTFISTAGVSQIGYAEVERASQVVTVTASAATAGAGYLKIQEWSGLNNADLLEAQAQDSQPVGTVTSHPTGPVSTLIDKAVLIGVLQGSSGAYDGTPTGFTEVYDAAQGVAAYKILAAPTTNENWVPTSAANELSTSSLAAFNGMGEVPPPAGSVPVIVQHMRQQGIG